MIVPLVILFALAVPAALVLRIALRDRTRLPARPALSYEQRREEANLAFAKREYAEGRITLEEFEAALPGILETAHEPQVSAGRPAVLSSPRPIKPAEPTYLCGSTGEDLGRPGCTTAPETYSTQEPVVLVDGLGRVIARYPKPSPKPTPPGYEGH